MCCNKHIQLRTTGSNRVFIHQSEDWPEVRGSKFSTSVWNYILCYLFTEMIFLRRIRELKFNTCTCPPLNSIHNNCIYKIIIITRLFVMWPYVANWSNISDSVRDLCTVSRVLLWVVDLLWLTKMQPLLCNCLHTTMANKVHWYLKPFKNTCVVVVYGLFSFWNFNIYKI